MGKVGRKAGLICIGEYNTTFTLKTVCQNRSRTVHRTVLITQTERVPKVKRGGVSIFSHAQWYSIISVENGLCLVVPVAMSTSDLTLSLGKGGRTFQSSSP